MIEELLPESVVAVEAHGDDPLWDAPLHPEEEPLVARAVAKRRREFAAVRGCARRAMEKLGVAAHPVVNGDRGVPLWPAGLTGSMTHCDGYCAAALVRVRDLASLGIDAEPHGPLPEGVGPSVLLPAEAERVALLAAQRPAVHWDRIVFSAKESVYKAWYPLTRKWLDFSEADITLRPDPGGRTAGTLHAELLVPGPLVGGHRLQSFDGRWLVHGGVVATAVTVPHA
ncbi:4'-phosphopantetheinyl transferase [Streptomyces sp. NPDC059688]|uniref:4'-phosphopantetheinyl transferase superfamily protein n=1 Tax=Streptomyces sp. 900105245 TaxID=3154379 RepID=A0ABV1UGB5_9ACTN|nr:MULTISPECIES: 4'-phosphopantetheinyl transferase superfamily protein [unclassified Streptomyces]OKJ84919.1 4'-phosphopantetheinyl transferase [Streptomyces sp. CB01883]ROP46684.1 4'-phosphopantetheinyl transferase EntD [Streptomyces sp. PanSC9]